jgi:3'-phosphoadenosine 5'-phosphosulfate sulfotransferase (PAPS reductase)/FAD synthetase
MTPLDRHERGALQFSGGKDSLALVYLLRPYWNKLTIYHVDTGDLLPEVREIVDMVEGMVPDFRRIETDSTTFMHTFGLPTDLRPCSSTAIGLSLGLSKQRLVDRFDCCAFNLMKPMHDRMIADRVPLVIRGTKRADTARMAAESGDTSMGYELWLPLQDWSHDEVFEYLRSVDAPICRIYEHRVNSPECATCPAWTDERRASYLKQFHPELYQLYRVKLRTVAAELAPWMEGYRSEMEIAK